MSEEKAAVEPTTAAPIEPGITEDIKLLKTPSIEKYKWSDRQVEVLISEWAKEPCLYDAAHEDYCKSDKRQNIEQRIVAAINENVVTPGERILNVPDIKKKMNGLRTYHRTLWKKKTDFGLLDETNPSWQYYDQLMFLNDHFQPREVTMASMPKRKLNLDGTVPGDDDEDRKPGFEYISNLNGNPTPASKSRRLLKAKGKHAANEVMMRSSGEYAPRKETSPEMLFGEIVGHSLKSIKDERTREFAKLQIQQILFKCRYPDDHNSQNVHTQQHQSQPTSSSTEEADQGHSSQEINNTANH